MHAELIHVGTELLLGGILNTNAQYLSLRLAELGIDLYFQTVVGDNQSRIIEALKIAGKRADIVILTGGLGPTSDDLTKESLCSFLNVPLFLREDILASIEEIFQKRGTKMPRNNVKQAMFPKEGIILGNDMGTAPGLFISQRETSFYLLPGPPSEMKNMFEKEVFPILSSQIGQTLHSKSLKVFGIGESMAEMLIQDLMESQTNPTIAPYAGNFGMEFRITAKAPTRALAEQKIIPVETEVRKRLGDNIYGVDKEELEDALVFLLHKHHYTISVAESLTGGLITGKLVNVSGVSSVFLGGITAYTKEMKQSLLSIPGEILELHGTVSETCAALMAENIKSLTHSDLGLSITGVAGPDNSEGKPVGLVYIGMAFSDETKVVCHTFVGNRNQIRERSAKAAIDELRRALLCRCSD